MIVLTGASGGIGAAIINKLALHDDIIGIYLKNSLINCPSANVTLCKVDLSAASEINDFYRNMESKLERLTLIHSAVISQNSLAMNLDPNSWDETMNVNLKANFLLTKLFLKKMIAEKWGRIIHISSIAGIRGVPGTIAYSASKTGLLGMSRVLAKEYGRFGVTSNVIMPGYLNTGLIETLKEEDQRKILAEIPSKQLGDPINVVNAIKFLIDSDYVNGSVIPVDGGI